MNCVRQLLIHFLYIDDLNIRRKQYQLVLIIGGLGNTYVVFCVEIWVKFSFQIHVNESYLLNLLYYIYFF